MIYKSYQSITQAWVDLAEEIREHGDEHSREELECLQIFLSQLTKMHDKIWAMKW